MAPSGGEDRAAAHLEKRASTRKEELQYLRGCSESYANLNSLLEELPTKLRHEVMVPFGSLAFFEGSIEHTNEVLMLLGDNWFVERTAARATQTINSRRKFVVEQIRKLESEVQNLQSTIDLAKEEATGLRRNEDGIVEIKEDLEAESGLTRSFPADMKSSAELTKTDLMKLRELERQEEEEEEEDDEDEDEEENERERIPPLAKSPADLYGIMEEREKAQAKKSAPSPAIGGLSGAATHKKVSFQLPTKEVPGASSPANSTPSKVSFPDPLREVAAPGIPAKSVPSQVSCQPLPEEVTPFFIPQVQPKEGTVAAISSGGDPPKAHKKMSKFKAERLQQKSQS